MIAEVLLLGREPANQVVEGIVQLQKQRSVEPVAHANGAKQPTLFGNESAITQKTEIKQKALPWECIVFVILEHFW